MASIVKGKRVRGAEGTDPQTRSLTTLPLKASINCSPKLDAGKCKQIARTCL